MGIAIKILGYIGTAIAILCLHKAVYFIVGLFKRRKFPKTKNLHKYAICIPARNEEIVIRNILDSIDNQKYPKELISIFVVADNCTDRTAERADEFAQKYEGQCVCYRHNNKNERTKGYALKYLFEQIEKDYGIESFDGYFVFDADNVLMDDYVLRMNEAFDAGNKIVTSFRNSKNLNQNWISWQYAMHWMRTCQAENRGKSILNWACRIQGTGFLFANELVKDGWKYTSLTEDRAFCSDAVIQNYNITYCEDAVFFDEQPYKFKVVFRQRIRWSKGHLLSAVENCPKLLKNVFTPKKKFWSSWEMFWINFPSNIESGCRKILKFILQLTVAILSYNCLGFFGALGVAIATGVAETWLAEIANEILVMIYYRKRIGKLPFLKTVFNVFMFPLFGYIGKLTDWIALFKKVEWKAIPHDTVVDMKMLQNNSETQDSHK